MNHKSKEAEFDGATPAIVAAQDGSLGCLQLLLACNDLEIDRGDAFGLSPLHHGARLGHVKCVEALLDAGASPAKAAKGGATALHCASAADQSECVRAVLLRCNSALARRLLAARDGAGLTPLQCAREERAHASEEELLAAWSRAEEEDDEARREEEGGTRTRTARAETEQLLV